MLALPRAESVRARQIPGDAAWSLALPVRFTPLLLFPTPVMSAAVKVRRYFLAGFSGFSTEIATASV